ncbi:MAG: homoserine O-acetyltransferase [Gammaproteobacteria bacterium]|nr:homoserine O-acetyltransferase [Gammaproteobacteria bacterium]
MALVRTPPSATHEQPARRLARLEQPLVLYRGGVIEQAVVAYECWGQLNAARDNAVLVFTGLSPSAHAASSAEDPRPGWWETMIGAGRPIDTSRFFVVCVNSLGSPYGSSSPASLDPRTGRRYGIHFPEVAVEDIARAGREALRTLGIERVAAVVGPSLGGMVVLAYCAQFPGEVENLVTISGAARATPFAIALRSLQREMVRSDPAWRGGNYEPGRGPRLGLRLARKLGTITYRSAEEWQERFGRQRGAETAGMPGDFRPQFEVEAYLEHQALRFADTFDANCYLYLSRAMDQFDLADHGGGSLAAAFDRLGVQRSLVLGVETDLLFPVGQQREIADHLRAAGGSVDYHAFPSLQGHDAFLTDLARFEPAIGGFLKRIGR